MPPTKRDPIAASIWGHTPRPTAAEPGLSREQIVAAAIALLDADGLDGLSMRKLGTKLNVGTTSVYWYVANKGELLDLALDEVYGQVDVPDPPIDDWRAVAADFVRSVRATLSGHPWVMALFGIRPGVGPKATALSDKILGVFIDVGFTAIQAANASSALSAYAIGNAVSDSSWAQMKRSTGMSATEVMKMFEEYYRNNGDQYPRFAEWWREAQPFDMDTIREETFEFGLKLLIDGLAVQLDVSRSSARPSRPNRRRRPAG